MVTHSAPDKQDVVSPLVPSDAEWTRLLQERAQELRTAIVDVVVPVYKGYAETLRCLFSVLDSKGQIPFRLTVINDASPDDSLIGRISDLAANFGFTLLHNSQNQGFVKTCNRALRQAGDLDVVLLNSDAEVFGDWLDRLHRAAYRDSRTGTVTPFSNNAEICSYPVFARDNWAPLELNDRELDALAAVVNANEDADIPTGVGFCMYMRAACIQEIGLLDEENFGKGYGEENDFCRRAHTANWRNIHAMDVFVRHYGGASFGASKAERIAHAVKKVEELNPGYGKAVADFLHADPASRFRRRLDIGRVRRRIQGKTFLFISHNWGGGTEVHVQYMRDRLEAEGHAVLFCRMSKEIPGSIMVSDPLTPNTPNLGTFDVRHGGHAFEAIVADLGVEHIHIHNLADFPEEASDLFRCTADRLSIPYDLTLHDYLPICPRITLIDISGVYCGEPDISACETCLSRDGSPFGHPSGWNWRERYHRLLAGARLRIVPDQDVADRYHRYYPELQFVVRPHEEKWTVDHIAEDTRLCEDSSPKGRRIGIIGAIGPNKGSALIQETAKYCADNGIDLTFVIIGYTDRDEQLLQLPNIEITGRYDERDGVQVLKKANCNILWFPAVWPETYSYTLTLAILANVYPIAFDIGAIARRLRDAGWGGIMPLDYIFKIKEIALALQDWVVPAPYANPGFTSTVYPAPMIHSYYGLPATPPLPD
ncbi:glycosyltransferase [Achromobacter aegrifaciens]